MRNKIMLVLSLLLSMFLVACDNENEIKKVLEDVNIEMIDQIDIPVGTYQIPYEINDLDRLLLEGVSLDIRVIDQDDNMVTESGDSIVIESGMVYTVTVTLTYNDEVLSKTVTFIAIQTTEVEYWNVSFEVHGEEFIVEDQLVADGEKMIEPVELSREGYLFNGWYIDETMVDLYDFNTIVTENITLYADWVLEVYHITYQLIDGVNGDNPTFYTIESPIISLEAPMREGYQFGGWYDNEDFHGLEVVAIESGVTGNLTFYAKWIQELKVYYHFNGAPQTGELFEDVLFDDLLNGPSFNPIYDNHILLGWSKTPEGDQLWDFSSDSVTENLTLYAIWQFEKPVFFDTNEYLYFQQNTGGGEFNIHFPRITDQSTINVLGEVEMIKNIEMSFRYEHTQSLLSINDEPISIKLMYSDTGEDFDIYDSRNFVIELDHYTLGRLVRMNLNTEPLSGNKQYHFAYVIEFEEAIVVSNVYQLHTPHLVPSGEKVGSNVISGAHYVVSPWLDYNHPNYEGELKFVIYADYGFNAYLGDFEFYNDVKTITKSGYYTYTTHNKETNVEYLHVIHVQVDSPRVLFEFENHSISNNQFNVNFSLQMNQTSLSDFNKFELQAYGVIVSTNHSSLKMGVPNTDLYSVEVMLNTILSVSFELDEPDSDVIYIRPFAIVDDRVDYGLFVYEFSYNQTTSTYDFSKTIYVDVQTSRNQAFYSASFFPTTTNLKLYSVVGENLTMQTYVGNIQFSISGQHFLYVEGNNEIKDISGVELLPVQGVENNGVYTDGVMITNPNIRHYYSVLYIIYEGTDEAVYLPYQVLITRKGIHTVYYETNEGIEEITFTIE